jgi:hypothetical protein
VNAAERRLRRFALAALILLGVALQLPSLFAGFYLDDYVLELALSDSGKWTPMRPWSLFDFGSRADWTAFEHLYGSMPWWTSPEWSVRFLRPLASLSFTLDYAVWGGRAMGHHFTSLLLYALLLALCLRLYRAIGLSSGVALIALLLLALSDAAVFPVGWPANRNALLEAIFAVSALTVAVQGRKTGASIGSALALAACASLCKESGAISFLLLAWWLVSDRIEEPNGARRARRAAWIAVAAFVAWLAFLSLAGYGTHSLFYATPWREPLRYASNLAVLVAGGALSLVGPWPIDVVTAAPQMRGAILIAGVVIGLPLWVWIARSLRTLAATERRGMMLLALWTILFLLPQAGAAPGDRLLFVASIGACGLVAQHLAVLRERWRGGRLSLGAKLAAATLVLCATLGSATSSLAQGIGMARFAEHVRTTTLATDVGSVDGGPVYVIALQTESQLQGFALGATWHGAGGDPAVQFSLLQNGPRPLRWTRLTDNAFELESLGKPFLVGPFELVYLAREDELRVPHPMRTSLFEVRAEPHPSGELRKLHFTFERSLDDPALRFVAPSNGTLSRVRPPAVGETVELPAPVPTLPFVP